MPDTSPNRDQSALWNNGSGKTWVELQAVLDNMLLPFEHLLTDVGFPGEGRKVLDIGCGCGATTLAMARRVGLGGQCLGVDISKPLVEAAMARAAAEGVTNASFVEGDAQTFALGLNQFDAVISRFGVMFFDDPVAAFANIRRAVVTGALLNFAAWRSPADNDFMTAAGRAAAHLLPEMPKPSPNAPGQFAFADSARVHSILSASGWSNITITVADRVCQVPEEDLMTYITRLGPVGLALRGAEPSLVHAATAALRTAFEPFIEDGVARFTAGCWLVTAQSAA